MEVISNIKIERGLMEQSSSFRGNVIPNIISKDGVGVEVGVYQGHFQNIY